MWCLWNNKIRVTYRLILKSLLLIALPRIKLKEEIISFVLLCIEWSGVGTWKVLWHRNCFNLLLVYFLLDSVRITSQSHTACKYFHPTLIHKALLLWYFKSCFSCLTDEVYSFYFCIQTLSTYQLILKIPPARSMPRITPIITHTYNLFLLVPSDPANSRK